MSETSQPDLCQLYLPGHNVHWIHARKMVSLPRFRVTNLSVDGDTGFVTFHADGRQHVLWTHNALWITALHNHYGVLNVHWCPSPNTLCVETEPPTEERGRKSALFYLVDEPSPCTDDTIPGHPISEIRLYDDDSHHRD